MPPKLQAKMFMILKIFVQILTMFIDLTFARKELCEGERTFFLRFVNLYIALRIANIITFVNRVLL